MHLADGVLVHSVPALAFNAAGAVGLGLALRRLRGEPGPGGGAAGALASAGSHAAWAGTLGAFVLALQMVNLPLLPGTSAHAVGAGLVAALLGPARAVVTLSAVLIVQALLLADGGVTVLGANILHLAVLPALAVAASRRALGGVLGTAAAAAWGAWLGSLLGAASLAALLVLGAEAPATLTFGWLLGVQGLAGAFEAVLTGLAVARLERQAPALVHAVGSAGGPRRRDWLVAAAATVALLALAPMASARPDVLESLLAQLGRAP